MRNVASYRMRRINEALKEIIGTSVAEDIKDPRVGFVTLTGVETAPDLRHAKVFVSVYGKKAEKDATMEGLRSAEAFLQRRIGDELHLKRTPKLEFVYDASIDYGMKIQVMLKASGAEELGPGSPAETAAETGSGEGDGT
jgi:ribosome-binding factor A